MSYDIWLTADLGGPEPLIVGGNWNYTSNCSRMWCAAGADLAEFHDRPAGEAASTLRAAISELEANPDPYRAMNPPNGWGSYDSLQHALRNLLAMFEAAPNATVRVSR